MCHLAFVVAIGGWVCFVPSTPPAVPHCHTHLLCKNNSRRYFLYRLWKNLFSIYIWNFYAHTHTTCRTSHFEHLFKYYDYIKKKTIKQVFVCLSFLSHFINKVTSSTRRPLLSFLSIAKHLARTNNGRYLFFFLICKRKNKNN